MSWILGGIIPTTLDEHDMRDVVVDVVEGEGWTSSRGISRRDSVIFYCVFVAVSCLWLVVVVVRWSGGFVRRWDVPPQNAKMATRRQNFFM